MFASIFDSRSSNSPSIHQFYYSASTRLKSQTFSIRLNDESRVGTPLRQNLVVINCRYSFAQLCTCEDGLAYISGTPSNYYSVLYYNSEIWHLPTLKPNLKQKLLSASANAIKLCLTKLPPNTSFETIHSLAKRGTPTQMSTYKHALQLYKLFNSTQMSDDWVSLNVQQNFNGRNEKIQFYNISNYKVGRNLLVNRFKILNNKIDYSWFNVSFETFKIKCKQLLL